jgi:hypothetical protein
MTFQQFQSLVADLRHAQKEYFRTRSDAALDKAKSLEKRVDAALKELASTQKEMF